MSVAKVEDSDGEFTIHFSFGKVCEVKFSDRHSAETVAFYMRDMFRRGQEDVRHDIRMVLGLEQD